MIKSPNFGKMINWQKNPYYSTEPLRKWLLRRLPIEIIVSSDLIGHGPELRDIGALLEGEWSALRTNNGDGNLHYFFELESDAMAFKLKWI